MIHKKARTLALTQHTIARCIDCVMCVHGTNQHTFSQTRIFTRWLAILTSDSLLLYYYTTHTIERFIIWFHWSSIEFMAFNKRKRMRIQIIKCYTSNFQFPKVEQRGRSSSSSVNTTNIDTLSFRPTNQPTYRSLVWRWQTIFYCFLCFCNTTLKFLASTAAN